MRKNVTTAIVLDTRRAKQGNTYPVKIRVTFQRVQKYYRTNFNLTKEDFEATQVQRPRKHYKDISMALAVLEGKAIRIIEGMLDFDFDEFKRKWESKKLDRDNVFSYFDNKLEELKKAGKVGTADVYQNSKSSILEFYGKENLPFARITVGFLNKYEQWMLKNKKSTSTIGIYLRALRAIFNDARSQNLIEQDIYPFGKRKYQIPNPQNVKKALALPDIKKIFFYKAEPMSQEQWARDVWVFSYLCNGINMVDIARLQYSAISDQSIVFSRKKTEGRGTRAQKPVQAVRSEEVQVIINRWGNQPGRPNQYVFPIIKKGLDSKTEKARIKQATKQVNKYLGRICEKIEIEKITTYSARHSFATVLKRSGSSIEFISEALGHSDIRTTENYLDSFQDEQRKKEISKLTNFDEE